MQDAQVRRALIGQSPAFLQAIADLQPIAMSGKPVLVEGETGTGKEIVARAIHYLSARGDGPLVCVNCGAIPETLLEDELFGHERGAFTGAQARRDGLLAQASKGTLFLDEIDALSPRGQVALLRVLQDQRYRPVGATTDRQADVRVVAATNASMDQRTEHGDFRRDLFYRLCIFRIHLPPLRNRVEDILPLALHFLEKHCPEAPRTFTPAACAALLAHPWRGNVRELENAVVRACHLCGAGHLDGAIDVSHLRVPPAPPDQVAAQLATPAASGSSVAEPMTAAKRRVVDDFEKQYLLNLMSGHRGNVTQAAHSAGKERRELGKLLKKHRIDPRRFVEAPI